jgi:hypothetical protein
MATATESTFINAVIAAESTRQGAKAAAFTTYAYVAANLATYKIAVADADVAYSTAVNTARDASNLTLGNVGDTGPFGGYIARILSE